MPSHTVSAADRFDAVLHQKVARRVRAVNFEALGRGAVARREPQVVKHRGHVQQLQVWLEPEATSMQRAEEVRPPGVVEQDVVFGAADELGSLAHQRGVGNHDAGNGFR